MDCGFSLQARDVEASQEGMSLEPTGGFRGMP
jgi:hypothetical protein